MCNLSIRKTIYIFIIAVISMQLFGCGGGGSSEAPIIPSDTDKIAPLVTLAVPLDNATDVQLNTSIEVSFNELMNSSTVNTSSFIVKDALGNLVPGVITESNTTYLFNPVSDLEYDASYTVTITTSVTDLANNNLETPYSWSFSTLALPGATSPVSLNVSDLTDTSVTLNGLFTNPSNYTTTAWFEYGLTDSYGSSTPSVVYAAVATIDHSADLINLPDKTTYHYRIVTQNNDGVFYGDDKTFRTYISAVTMADDLDHPSYLHLYNNELYWVEIYSDRVRKISVNGGAATTEASSAMTANSASLEMDMTHLYWGDQYNIWMKPIGTGAVTTVASSLPNVYDLRVYSSDLFVRNSDGINKIAIAGGSLSTVVSNQTYYISSYEVDASGIYWTHYDGSINKSALDGSSVVTLAVGLSSPHSLILESGKLYWAESNAIRSMSTSGGQITTIAENVSPTGMVKDATNIYFAEEADYNYGYHNITSVNTSTGEVEVLTMGKGHSSYPTVRYLVVGDSNIYWLVGGNHYYLPMGQLRKCAKSY